MHIIHEAFGEECDLYKDVLNCARDADKAALRKAYYRTALKYHPDKNPGDETAAATFQAVTAAYQILQDTDLRAAYDESGVIPEDDIADDDDHDDKNNRWKEYFDRIFGKVTVGDIEAFAQKYKCSDEERRDVLKEYTARKGNLEKMLEFVMLSEPRDATRWVEDYLRPAIEAKEVSASYTELMEKTLLKLQKKVEKQDAEEEEEAMEEVDDEKTESEEEEPPAAQRKRRAAEAAASKTKASKKSVSPKKGKPTKAKVKKSNDMTDLIAQIQNKRRGGGDAAASMMSNLGARYGVSMDDGNDPLNDKDFATIQSKLKGKKKKGT
jgi:DnaJ homolog subfamily C member 9